MEWGGGLNPDTRRKRGSARPCLSYSATCPPVFHFSLYCYLVCFSSLQGASTWILVFQFPQRFRVGSSCKGTLVFPLNQSKEAVYI